MDDLFTDCFRENWRSPFFTQHIAPLIFIHIFSCSFCRFASSSHISIFRKYLFIVPSVLLKLRLITYSPSSFDFSADCRMSRRSIAVSIRSFSSFSVATSSGRLVIRNSTLSLPSSFIPITTLANRSLYVVFRR